MESTNGHWKIFLLVIKSQTTSSSTNFHFYFVLFVSRTHWGQGYCSNYRKKSFQTFLMISTHNALKILFFWFLYKLWFQFKWLESKIPSKIIGCVKRFSVLELRMSESWTTKNHFSFKQLTYETFLCLIKLYFRTS